jgi:hypothetical protein
MVNRLLMDNFAKLSGRYAPLAGETHATVLERRANYLAFARLASIDPDLAALRV